MFDANFVSHMVTALAFSFMGIVIFILGFLIVDWWSPYDLWKEIVEEQNVALGVMVAGISLGVCVIIAASMAG